MMASCVPIGAGGLAVLWVLGACGVTGFGPSSAALSEGLSKDLGGEVKPLWTGWRIRTGDRRVDIRGGVYGVRTTVVVGGEKTRHEGMPDLEKVREILGI